MRRSSTIHRLPIALLLFSVSILFPIQQSYGHANIFIGKLAEHEIAGHGEEEEVHIPSSYLGVEETYTVVVLNERNISTTEVQVIIPQGMELISAEDREGWKLTILRPPLVPTPVLIWNGSSIPAGKNEGFFFSLRNSPNIFVYYFAVVQTYEDGENDVWRPWVQIISPTNIAGIEYSTVAFWVIIVGVALPFVERAGERIVKKNRVVST
ncbi:MAG: YcnI family protein [Thaumarchaeota archaeon]|nr:YcnI family protein [Nitrososphaerota archaeon]